MTYFIAFAEGAQRSPSRRQSTVSSRGSIGCDTIAAALFSFASGTLVPALSAGTLGALLSPQHRSVCQRAASIAAKRCSRI